MTYFKNRLILLLVVMVLCAIPLRSSDKDASDTRKYLTTIRWYPEEPEELHHMVENFFKHTNNKEIPGQIRGIISPHAGLSYSGQCAANAYKHLEGVKDLERIILLGVSHRARFYGAMVSDFKFNATPLGSIPVDYTVTKELLKEKLFDKSNEVLQNEHSIENQLPLLQYILQKNKNENYKIVPILIGYLDEKDFPKLASIIEKYVTPKTIIIASSDFTHYGASYGYTPFYKNIKDRLTTLDMGMAHYVETMDLEGFFKYKKKTGITVCGYAPIGILMSLLKKNDCTGTLADYYKSADPVGDYSMSVSYAAFVISQNEGGQAPSATTKAQKPEEIILDNDPQKLSLSEKKTLLSLARFTLEEHFQERSVDIDRFGKTHKITPLMQEQTGVFVTLRKKGDLRGCIGTLIGRDPLVEAVRDNALNAAFKDHRFPALKKDELSKIDIEISVMTPLEKIDDYKTIRLGTDGVIIRKDGYQSVYLPQVATETGWDLDTFLGNLCQKAGLPYGAYQSEDMEFYIFQALVFEEKEIMGKK